MTDVAVADSGPAPVPHSPVAEFGCDLSGSIKRLVAELDAPLSVLPRGVPSGSWRCLLGIGLSDGAFGGGEADLGVGAITERLAGGATTATERDGRTIDLILRPVGVNHGDGTLHQVWAVLEWRDRDCVFAHTAWSTTLTAPLEPSEGSSGLAMLFCTRRCERRPRAALPGRAVPPTLGVARFESRRCRQTPSVLSARRISLASSCRSLLLRSRTPRVSPMSA